MSKISPSCKTSAPTIKVDFYFWRYLKCLDVFLDIVLNLNMLIIVHICTAFIMSSEFLFDPIYFCVGFAPHSVRTRTQLVLVFSDVLVAFLYFDICHYRLSNLAIENPEFSQPVVAGHFLWVGSESPCRAELPTHKVYFSISSSVEIFQK